MSAFSSILKRIGPYGIYAVARLIARRCPRVLMYHRFSEKPSPGFTSSQAFETQVKEIASKYRPMTLAQLTEQFFLLGNTPAHAVVITVDDGYRDFYEIAFPILKKHDVPATFFVTTGFVDGRLWLWPDQVAWMLAQVKEIYTSFSLGGLEISPGKMDPPRRRMLWNELIEKMLSTSDKEKNAMIAELAQKLNLSIPWQAPEEYAGVTWDQLKEVQAAGIEIGGHTMTHPSLACVDETGAINETFGCMSELKACLGDRPRTFCYPNGTPSDFKPGLKEIVKEAGFKGAVLAYADALGLRDRYAMRRHSAGDGLFQFQKAVSGLELLSLKMRIGVGFNSHD